MSDWVEHWENVYGTKKPEDTSWYQAYPAKSLELIQASGISKEGSILEVGGGASVLAGQLLDLGYRDVTVLDISPRGLNYAKERLGRRAGEIKWIEADATRFEPIRKYDLLHDRAVFHFLIEKTDRDSYAAFLRKALKPSGHFIVATFAPDGPETCSGLPVRRYDAESLALELGVDFRLVSVIPETHRTPWGKEQKFMYFLFNRI